MPPDQRADAYMIIKSLKNEMRAEGNTARDISTYLLLLYWVINYNAWNATFWLTAHILNGPPLREAIESELSSTSPLCPGPILTAAYHETLRTTTSSISAREVAHPCTIGGLTLQSGARIVVPSRQTLIDAQVFGAQPKLFDPARFLADPSLARSPSFCPFGGGVSYCPGRFIAQSEAVGFVAAVMAQFEVAVVEGKGKVPNVDVAKPCLGVMEAVAGQDVLIKVKEKRV